MERKKAGLVGGTNSSLKEKIETQQRGGRKKLGMGYPATEDPAR